MTITPKYIGHFQFIEVSRVQPKWLRSLGRGWNVVVKL